VPVSTNVATRVERSVASARRDKRSKACSGDHSCLLPVKTNEQKLKLARTGRASPGGNA
jgi:hypothetical protein